MYSSELFDAAYWWGRGKVSTSAHKISDNIRRNLWNADGTRLLLGGKIHHNAQITDLGKVVGVVGMHQWSFLVCI